MSEKIQNLIDTLAWVKPNIEDIEPQKRAYSAPLARQLVPASARQLAPASASAPASSYSHRNVKQEKMC